MKKNKRWINKGRQPYLAAQLPIGIGLLGIGEHQRTNENLLIDKIHLVNLFILSLSCLVGASANTNSHIPRRGRTNFKCVLAHYAKVPGHQ